MKTTILVPSLLAAATLALAGQAQAAVVYANGAAPGDNYSNAGASNQGQAVGASGWYYNNVRNSGVVGINTAYARSGNGSANLSTTLGPGSPSSKADIEYLANAVQFAGNWFANGSLGLFTSLTSMSYDWYRNSSSTSNAGQHPAMRVLLDMDGNLATNDRGGLVFERAYNGGGAAPTDTWTSESIGANTNVWNFGLGLGNEFDIDGSGSAYDDTLAEWQASGRLANAVIVGFSVGVGSGWGPFDGAADNIGWTIGNQSMSTNFEVQSNNVPEPATLALAGLALLGAGCARRRAVNRG